MNSKEIEQGNKLIAEFMGIEHISPSYPIEEEYQLIKMKDGVWHWHELKYDSSFDWLMPVVEKIESIVDSHHGHFGVHITSNCCVIQATNFRPDKPMADPPHYYADNYGDTKIKAVFIAVVNFIRYYNTKNNNTNGQIEANV